MSRWSAPTAYCFTNAFINAQDGPAVGPFARNASDCGPALPRARQNLLWHVAFGYFLCDELLPDDAAETDAGLCPVCHDHMAWYEQACAGGPSLLPTGTEAAFLPASLPAPIATFTFVVGHRVQLIANAPAAVTWCGQHKVAPSRHGRATHQRLPP